MKKYLFICICILFIVGFTADTFSGPNLRWNSFKDYADQGNSGGKKIFIHFWAAWCQYCYSMDRDTFSDPSVIAALNEEFYPIKVDTDKEPLVAGMFGVRGLPHNMFLTEEGKILANRPGYMPPQTFLQILRAIKNRDAVQ